MLSVFLLFALAVPMSKIAERILRTVPLLLRLEAPTCALLELLSSSHSSILGILGPRTP